MNRIEIGMSQSGTALVRVDGKFGYTSSQQMQYEYNNIRTLVKILGLEKSIEVVLHDNSTS